MLRNTSTLRSFIRTQSTRPYPVNVEAVYYSPLKLPIKYGDLVADIQLRSYDNENLDFYSDFILRTGYYLGIPLTGPKPLPTRRERWTVIKSPFVHAKSKENFERHTHKRLIRAWDTNPEVLQLLISYITKHSMAGVGMKCNFFQKSEISVNFDSEANDIEKSLSNVSDLYSLGNDDKVQSSAVGEKVLELLNSPDFKKHLEKK
ncbi:mitochondrial 37S ribosomal protein uS10m [Saccharomyces paradoxus]|uniref:Small ribosomal subunit protein uS10m n=1 Tax=Saccharomyces paradoxus TaxID=27291 RepID=A0A8B8UNF2_SACPA|nr:Rsm10 [Saccharomyces paradoxus]QHS72260.1 Rsm10 [Saccharomyces paradoxus]